MCESICKYILETLRTIENMAMEETFSDKVARVEMRKQATKAISYLSGIVDKSKCGGLVAAVDEYVKIRRREGIEIIMKELADLSRQRKPNL